MRKIRVLMIFVWACQSQQKINSQPTVPELVMGAVRGVDHQQWSPPVLKLGDAVHPRRYGVRLRIVPSEQTFTGRMDIDLMIKEATSIIWLNGSEVAVTDAKLTADGRTVPAAAVPGGEDFLGFAIDSPVRPGDPASDLQRKVFLARQPRVVSPRGGQPLVCGEPFRAGTRAAGFPMLRRTSVQGAVAAHGRGARRAARFFQHPNRIRG